MQRPFNLIILLFSFFVIASCLPLNAQNSEKKGQKTLFKVGSETVPKEEFKYIYEKNNSDDPNLYSKKSLKDYLDLYIEFKLKVKAAKEAGIDTTKKFRKEFKNYRDQLAEPYLTNDTLMEKLVKEAYQRKQQLVKAKHFTLKMPIGAPPEDTAQAYQTLQNIKQKFEKGKSLQELVKNSQDEVNFGNMGYFSVFKQPYPIENAVYNTSVGKMAGPVRTQYGYHLLKVTDKKPNKGKIKVRHIMVKPKKNKNDTANWERAKRRIQKAYQALENDESFKALVKQYSEDRRSKRNEGKLPPFGRLAHYYPNKFKKKAFSLEQNGDYTKPFKTQYGYHILKRIDLKEPASLSKIRQQLVKQIKKDGRYKKVKASVVNKLKENNDFQKFNNLSILKKQFDSTLLKGEWEIKKEKPLSKPLFQIGDKKISLLNFAGYIQKNQKQSARFKTIKGLVNHHYKNFEQDQILAYHKAHLGEKYPEFRNLLKEYKEGILLFEIMDKKVWSKAIQDSSGLKQYYEKHKSQYKSPLTKIGYLIPCQDQSTGGKIKNALKKGREVKSVASNFNNVGEVKYDSFQKAEHPIVKKTKDKKGVYNHNATDTFYIVKIEKVIPPEIKAFDAIRGKVVADYQDHLEEQWIKTLREKYPVKLNDKVFESLIKE